MISDQVSNTFFEIRDMSFVFSHFELGRVFQKIKVRSNNEVGVIFASTWRIKTRLNDPQDSWNNRATPYAAHALSFLELLTSYKSRMHIFSTLST